MEHIKRHLKIHIINETSVIINMYTHVSDSLIIIRYIDVLWKSDEYLIHFVNTSHSKHIVDF